MNGAPCERSFVRRCEYEGGAYLDAPPLPGVPAEYAAEWAPREAGPLALAQGAAHSATAMKIDAGSHKLANGIRCRRPPPLPFHLPLALLYARCSEGVVVPPLPYLSPYRSPYCMPVAPRHQPTASGAAPLGPARSAPPRLRPAGAGVCRRGRGGAGARQGSRPISTG